MEIARKGRWKTVEMSKPHRIETNLNFTVQQFEKIKFGCVPREMEDKWFIFCDDNVLYFHRSWTGFLIYKVPFVEHESSIVINEFWVESDQDRYSASGDEYYISSLSSHLDYLSERKIINPIANGIYGLVVGDALGVPAEFRSREQMKANPVTDMIGYGTYLQPPGTWSDDSSLALCLADELTGKYDLQKIGQSFYRWLYHCEWTPHGKVFDVGISTREALERLHDNGDARYSGNINEHSNGNGSLMRILPLLFHVENIRDRVERYKIIKEVSSITHAHVRSCLACFYYLEFASFAASEIRYPLKDAYGVANHSLKELMSALDISPKERELFARLLDGKIGELPENEIRSTGYVIHTLEAAVWCLLTTHSYREAVLRAVNLGEDTDTTAAVTGGLAGLYYRKQSIPEEWIGQIARRDDIEEVIKRLSYKYKIAYLPE